MRNNKAARTWDATITWHDGAQHGYIVLPGYDSRREALAYANTRDVRGAFTLGVARREDVE